MDNFGHILFSNFFLVFSFERRELDTDVLFCFSIIFVFVNLAIVFQVLDCFFVIDRKLRFSVELSLLEKILCYE